MGEPYKRRAVHAQQPSAPSHPLITLAMIVKDEEEFLYGHVPEAFERRGGREGGAEPPVKEPAERRDDPRLLYEKASTYRAAANYRKAVELYKRIARSGSSNIGPRLYYEWVECLTSDGRPEEALAVCKETDRIGLKHPQLHYARGRALLALHRLDESLEQFELAMNMGRERPASGDHTAWEFKVFDSIARVYAIKKDWKKVQEFAAKSLELMPDDVETLRLTAVAHKAQGRTEQTVGVLEQILEINPNEPNAHSELAKLAIEAQDHAKARKHLERFVELCPERFEIHQQLAGVYEELSMPEQALREYRRTIEIHPRSLYALNNMARLLADRRNYQEALDCIIRAIEIDPHWANVYFNAGDILCKAGALEEAKSAYERALQLDPGNAVGFFMLGNCYLKQGDYHAAELAYCYALSLQPQYPEAESNLALAQSCIQESTGKSGELDILRHAA